MTAHACTIVPARAVADIDTIVRLAQTIWMEHYTPIIGADQVRSGSTGFFAPRPSVARPA